MIFAVITGFIKCLFDSHDLVLDHQCMWYVCSRCGEVRMHEDEYEALYGPR